MSKSGIEIFLEMLAEFGVQYLFANPGTTELPLNDALCKDDRFQYILGLQEVPVMSMADGFSMASGSLGVVNLHISCGLGNAMGMLYNAYREGTPLLVTAGQQDRRLRFEEPILWGEMVEVARPWTKWAVEVERIEDLPTAIRRAVQTALTPPRGPVFLSLPLDIQMEMMEMVEGLELGKIRLPDHRVRPPLGAIEAAVDLLLQASRPAILAGSRVTEADAIEELVRFAELLGAPVFSEPGTTHGRQAFPSRHPLNAQGLPLWSPEVRERLEEFDVLFVTGMDLLRQYVYHEPARAIPEHLRIIHLDEDPRQLGKNYPTEVGLMGDTKTGLEEVAARLQQRQSDGHRQAARDRFASRQQQHETARQQLRQQIDRERAERPMTSLTLMDSVARVVPDDIVVIEEAVTTTNTTLERLGKLGNTTGYFGHRGWTLGWGLGCAVGAQLAWPDRPVLALLGEGAAMYGISGLWSAARYHLPVTFLICNNAQYRILKVGAKGLGLPRALENEFVGLDLNQPEIDFVGLARSLGVRAERITEPDQLSETLRDSWGQSEPRLIDVPIAREVPNRLNYG